MKHIETSNANNISENLMVENQKLSSSLEIQVPILWIARIQ